jgi:hypothetical protein
LGAHQSLGAMLSMFRLRREVILKKVYCISLAPMGLVFFRESCGIS